MPLLRMAAITLPQLLLILFVAGSHDLLGGWNQTDSAMGTLLVLFLLTPVVTLALLIIEFIRLCNTQTGKRKIVFLVLLAAGLFVESLAIDLYLLTQVRMH